MSRSRQAAVLYAAAGAVHVAVPGDLVDDATKPLLMPLLALYAVAAYRECGARVSHRLLLSLALAWARPEPAYPVSRPAGLARVT